MKYVINESKDLSILLMSLEKHIREYVAMIRD